MPEVPRTPKDRSLQGGPEGRGPSGGALRSRRAFLGGAASLAGAALVAACRRASDPPGEPRSTGGPGGGAAIGSRVVQVHGAAATTWSGESAYWEHVDQSKVDQMVERGLAVLTGAPDAVGAWRRLLPRYQPGQAIAIKVNFNNQLARECASTSPAIDALVEPVNALARTLIASGVVPADIRVYDASRSIPARFAGRAVAGIQLLDSGTCRATRGFGPAVEFHPPAGIPSPATVRLSNVLADASYVINMPILKNHGCAGVSLGFKNHLGSVDDPGAFHDYILRPQACSAPRSSPSYSPLLDLYQCPHIGPKTALIVGDGLFGARGRESAAPERWSTFGGAPPSSLLFAVDPVAVDSVMCDLLGAESGSGIPAGSDAYLELAAAAGLGVHERGDPWRAGGYSRIDFHKVEI